MDALGASPYQTILNEQFLDQFVSFRHRFTAGEDLVIVCCWLSQALQQAGSLESFFLPSSKLSQKMEMKDLLSDFVQRFTNQKLPPKIAKAAKVRAQSLKYLLSDPLRGSACKRLNMFLRWMVRPSDGIDLGLWKRLNPHQLMLPVDTHVLKTLHLLDWTTSKTATWKVSEQATQHLRLYEADDPVRYDFALCHLSMNGNSIEMYY